MTKNPLFWNKEGYFDGTAGEAVQRADGMPGLKTHGPERGIIGRQNRASGETFEKWIALSCEYYWEKGYACIEKTPEAMKPLKPYGDRRAGQFVACYTRQAQPDFKGVLCDGSCIIFDAKHTGKDRIRQDAVTAAQWEAFDRYQSMGARCFVVVSIGLESFYRIPWGIWTDMKGLFGHRHMSSGIEIEPYRVPARNCRILFLEGVELRYEDIQGRTFTEDQQIEERGPESHAHSRPAGHPAP